jgi:hypothetical protein
LKVLEQKTRLLEKEIDYSNRMVRARVIGGTSRLEVQRKIPKEKGEVPRFHVLHDYLVPAGSPNGSSKDIACSIQRHCHFLLIINPFTI